MTRSVLSCGIGAERLSGGADRLLLARREGAQRVLDSVAELGRDAVRHVGRALRHVVDADALRANESRHPLDLVDYGLGRRR